MPQTPTPPPAQPRRPTAAPALQLTLELDKFTSFVSEYSGLVSLQGMFLKTHRLAPVGAQVAFELKLADGFSLCRGSGQVEWLRPTDGGPEQPIGLGLRFHALDEEGRQLILRILEEQVKGGGAPFELGQVPAGAISDIELSRRMLHEQDATIAATRTVPKTAPAKPAAAAVPKPTPAQPAAAAPKPAPAAPLRPPPAVIALGPAVSVKPGGQVKPPAPAVPDDFSPPWGKLPDFPDEMLEPFSAEPVEPLAPKAAPPAPAAAPSADDTWSGATSLFDDTAVGISHAGGGGGFEALEGALDAPADLDDDLSALSFDVVAEPGIDLDDSMAELELAALGTAPPSETVPIREPIPPAPLAPSPPAPPVARSPALAPPSPMPELELPEPMTAAQQAMRHPGFRAETARPPVPASRSFLDEPDELDLGPIAASPVPPAPAVFTPAAPPAEEASPEWNPTPWMEERPVAPGWRDRLQAWKPHLLAGALVVAVFGAVFAFRAPILDLLGMGPAPPPAAVRPAGPRPTPPPSAAPVPVPSQEVAAAPEPTTPESPPPEPAPKEPAPAMPAQRPLAASAPSNRAGARLLTRIAWQKADGATLVTLTFDGQLGAARFRNSRLDFADPRELFVLQGIEQPYAQSQIAVGTPEVARIRTGHHRKPGGDELHVVLDLAASGARVSAVRDLGDRLEIELRRR